MEAREWRIRPVIRAVPALLALAACNPLGVRVEPVPAPATARDPVADALAALARDDRRFLVIGGVWVWRVPGISPSCARTLKGDKQVRLVRFVSDAIEIPDDSAEVALHDSLQAEHAAVEQYLPGYNSVIADSTGICAPCSGTAEH